MPEGDTIFRSARALDRVLRGHVVQRVRAVDPAFDGLTGQVVDRVEARGKHLLMHTPSLVVHSHMGMTGSWHIYRAHELGAQSRRFARSAIELHTAHIAVCCTQPPVLEALRPDQVRAHPKLARLGPDLLSSEFDLARAHENFRAHDREPLGAVMLNQRVVAGLGNVYKSELCFMQRLDPFAPVARLDDDALDALLVAARRCMHDNLERSPRITRFVQRRPAGLWVYDRSGRPCHVCRQPVRVRRQSDMGRTTYFCRVCQRVPL